MGRSDELQLTYSTLNNKVHMDRSYTGKCRRKRNNNEELKNPVGAILGCNLQKNKSFTPAFSLVLFAIIVLLQSFNSVKANDEVQSFRDVEKMTASLAQLMNAIDLQNEVYRDSTIMKKVISEALDIENVGLFDVINKENIGNVKKALEVLDSLGTQKINASMGIAMALNELIFETGFTFPDNPMSELVDKLNAVDFPLDKYQELLNTAESNTNNIKISLTNDTFVQESRKSSENTLSAIRQLAKHVATTINDENHKYLATYSDGYARLFSYNIEYYKKLTDGTYLNMTTRILDNYVKTTTLIKSMLELNSKRDITKDFHEVYELVNTTAKISEKNYLIGFLQKSNDLFLLSNELEDDRLKSLLNNGKSLAVLKNLLSPVLKFWFQFANAENVWPKDARSLLSNLIWQNLIRIRKLDELNKHALSSIANVNTTLHKLIPIPYVAYSTLEGVPLFLKEYKIFAEALTNFQSLLKEFVNEIGIVEARLKSEDDTKFLDKAKQFYNSDDKVLPFVIRLKSHMSTFSQHKESFQTKITHAWNTLTEENFRLILDIVEAPRKLKLDIHNIVKLHDFVHTLSPLSEIENVVINNLTEVLLAVKRKLNESSKLGDKFKKEIEETKGFRRLTDFTWAREASIQLACSQRALNFYQREDLPQIVYKFSENGKIIRDRVDAMSEKPEILSGWSNISVFKQMVPNFLKEVEKLSFIYPMKEKSLKSFGDVLSSLDTVTPPQIDYSMWQFVLSFLASTHIGQVDDFVYVKKSLDDVADLQYALLRRKNLLSGLLAQADKSFKELFKEEQSTDWMSWALVGIGFFVIVVLIVLVVVIFWMWFISRKGAAKAKKSKGAGSSDSR
uniref:WSN domain-containing protein n=1 Tax=Caenorhabditis japonica TaxID=281687 RepID=A0A8R1E887_CAEJA